MSEITRALARIEKVDEVLVHDNADSLEIIKIVGWQVVAQKGLYKAGDLVVYFEVDSFLPIEPQYEFLRKSSFRSHPDLGEGFRIKTIKLRGEISQGLIMPLHEVVFDTLPQIGDDLTNLLRVKKYEPPVSGVSLGNNQIGTFPSFIPKTDQERWQNIRERDKRYDDTYEVTLKMDGSSMTVFYNEGEIGVCSRNFLLKDDETSLYWKTAKSYGLIAALNSIGLNVAIQGELIGPGVNKNRAKCPDHRFYIYDIYDISSKRYLSSQERYELIMAIDNYAVENIPGYKHLNHVFCFESHWTFDDLGPELLVKEFAKHIFPWNNEPLLIEGLVFKSNEMPWYSFKFINPEYLLKHDE